MFLEPLRQGIRQNACQRQWDTEKAHHHVTVQGGSVQVHLDCWNLRAWMLYLTQHNIVRGQSRVDTLGPEVRSREATAVSDWRMLSLISQPRPPRLPRARQHPEVKKAARLPTLVRQSLMPRCRRDLSAQFCVLRTASATSYRHTYVLLALMRSWHQKAEHCGLWSVLSPSAMLCLSRPYQSSHTHSDTLPC